MKKVLVVTGTPGVGKSSVSSLLASRLKGKTVSLSDLVQVERLDCGFDNERKTLVADTERVSRRVKEIINESEGFVIVDGHFAVNVVAVEHVFLAFVLRRNPDELRRVLKERGFNESKVTENLAAEILDVCLFEAVEEYGEMKVCEIDVSNRNVEDVVSEVVSVVEGRGLCHIGAVDWLMKLELEGRLDEFLETL
jgi:adenylate kinase